MAWRRPRFCGHRGAHGVPWHGGNGWEAIGALPSLWLRWGPSQQTGLALWELREKQSCKGGAAPCLLELHLIQTVYGLRVTLVEKKWIPLLSGWFRPVIHPWAIHLSKKREGGTAPMPM